MEESQNQNPEPRNRESGNLLKQISAERIVRPKGYYQTIALDGLTVLSAAASGYSIKLFFETGTIVPLAASACFLVLFSCFEVFLIASSARRFFILILETAALLSFFYREPLQLLLVAGLLLVGFLFWGEAASRSEARNSVEIRFFRTTGPLVKKTITALSLLIVILSAPQWSSGNGGLISKGWFDAAAGSSAQIAESVYPELNFHSTVRDFSLSLAKYELKGNDLFRNMSPTAQRETLNQLAGQIIGQADAYAAAYAGVHLSGAEPLGGALYGFADAAVEHWRASFGNWFLFAWALALFLLLRSFGALFWWLAAFLAFSAYKLFVAFDILQIRGEPAARETIGFS